MARKRDNAGRGLGSRLAPPRARLIALVVSAAFATAAQGNPNGPQVKSGTATFATSGSTLTVTNSPNAIIHWQGFSIGANETTRFVQQSAQSAVLNRVVGQDPSQILGTLQSNGRVFLVNPNGVVFGAGARVDVQGLVASTLNITDQDFLANKLKFDAGAVAGQVKNAGTITTPQGGQVYLIAPNVENSGVITSPKGEVILAAGKSVKLVDSLDPMLRVEVQAGGNAVNLGQVIADGGKAGIYAGLIEQRGTVRANSVSRDETGKIVFRASGNVTLAAGSVTQASGAAGGNITVQSDTGTTLVAGRVEATGSEVKGGRIAILGEQVGLVDRAVVDASGATGGGTVLIGGDRSGANPDVKNAKVTYIGPDVVVRADATQKGNGGKVIAWADDTARIYGAISARGGLLGGNGGFVETSGKRYLEVTRAPDITAPAGTGGEWLLDPEDITIQLGSDTNITAGPNFLPTTPGQGSILTVTTLQAALNNGGTVTIDTTLSGGTGNGDVTINAPVTKTGGASSVLAILANRNINVNSNVSTTSSGLTVNLTADQDNNGTGNVSIGAGIVTLGGNFSAIGQAIDFAAGGNLQTGGGDVSMTAKSTSGIALNGAVSRIESTGGNILLTADQFQHFGGGGTVAAGAGSVQIRPFTLSRPIVIEGTAGNASALNLTPGMLGTISGSKIEIGRSDGTGTLSTTTLIGSAHLNAPTLALTHGAVSLGGGIDFSADGEALELRGMTGGVSIANGVTVAASSLLAAGTGNLSFLGAATLNTALSATALQSRMVVGQTVTINGDATFGDLFLVNVGSVLTGTGNLTINGAMTWDSGATVSGSGNLATNGAVALAGGTNGANLFGTRVWNNNGTATFRPTAVSDFEIGGNATVNNFGTFDFNSSVGGQLTDVSGTAVFNNYGLVKKTLNTAPVTTTVQPIFNNQLGGTVEVQSGTLQFIGTGTDGGNYTVAAGATLGIGSPSRTINGNISGAGNVTFYRGVNVDGNVTLNGDYNIGGNTAVNYGGGWTTNLSVNGTVTNLGVAYSQASDSIDTISFAGIAAGESAGFANITSLTSTGGTLTFKNGTNFTALSTVSHTNGGTIDFGNAPLSLSTLSVVSAGTTITSTANIGVSGAMTWNSGGTISGSGVLATSGNVALAGGTNGANLLGTRTWNSSGTVTYQPTAVSVFTLGANATLNNTGTFIFDSPDGSQMAGTGQFVNAGLVRKTLNGSPVTTFVVPTFTNQVGGTVQVESGTLRLDNVSGGTSSGNISLAGGNLSTNGANLVNAGTGVISGNGVLNLGTKILTNNGLVAPGGNGSVGTLTITGNYVQTANGTLAIDLASANSRDLLAVSGNATLGGTLAVTNLGNYTPAGGDTHVVLTAANVTGTFASITGNGALATQYNGANFTLGIFGKFWDGEAGTFNWFDANNWTGNSVPTSSDDVTLDFAGSNTVSITGSVAQVKTLLSNESIALTSGGISFGSGNSSLASGTAFNFSGGTFTLGSGANLTIYGNLNVSGAQTLTGAGVANSTLAIASGGNLYLSGAGNPTLTTLTVNNNGLAVLASTNDLYLQSGTVFNNNTGGVFRFGVSKGVTASGGTYQFNNNAGGTVENATGFSGYFTQGGSSGAVTHNAGATLNTNGGTITFGQNGGGTYAGSSFVAAGNTVVINSGSHTLGNGTVVGGTLNVSGSATVSMSSANVAGTLNVDGSGFQIGTGTLTVESGANLNLLNGRTITGTAGVANSTLAISAGGNLNFSGAGNPLLTSLTVNNNGLAVLASTNDLYLQSGTVFNNNTGGVFRFGVSKGVTASGGTYQFNNNAGGTVENATGFSGYFTQGGSSGAVTHNAGATLNTNGGTITFGQNGGGTYAGSSFVAAGNTVVINSGSHTLGNGTVVGGTLNVSGSATVSMSSANVAGTLNVDGSGFQIGTGTLTVESGANLNLLNGRTITGTAGVANSTLAISAGGNLNFSGAGNPLLTSLTVNNNGLAVLASTNDLYLQSGTVFNNNTGGIFRFGVSKGVTASGGTYQFNNNAGGTVENAAGFSGYFTQSGGSGVFANNANATVATANGTITVGTPFSTNNGILDIGSGGSFSTSGAALTNSNTGVIRGSGTLNLTSATLTNNGTVQPGGTGNVGALSITGNYLQTANGTLAIDIASANSRDVLAVSGTATLAGNLAVTALGNYVSNGGDTHVVLTASSVSGTFASITGNGALGPVYNAANFTLFNSGPLTVFWDGGANTASWFDALNWSNDLLPGATDNVTITSIAFNSVTFGTGANASVASITTNQPLAISAGTLSFANASTFNSTVTLFGGTFNAGANASITSLAQSGGTLTGTGNLTVTGSYSFTGGTQSGPGNTTLGPAITHTPGTATIDRNLVVQGNLVLSGGTFTVSAGQTVDASTLAFSGGTLAGTGQLSVTGANSTWTGGVLAGNLRVAPGGTLTLAGGAKVIGTGGVLTNQGNVAWTAGNINTPASTNGAATIVNAAGGLFDIQGDVAFVDPVDDSGAFTMTVTLQNQAGGELRRSVGTGVVQLGGGTVDDSLLLNLQNDGTFNIATGAVQVNSYGTATANGGSFQIASGAAFEVAGGSHTFGNMSSSGAGQWRINGGTVGVSAGANANLSNLAFNGGTLNGPGEVLITGNGSSWNGGLFAGNLRVGAGGTLALAGGTKVLGSGALLTNQGNVVWSAGAIHSPASTNGTATIVNATGGLFDIQGDVAMLDPVDDSGAFTLTVTMQNQAGGELRRSVGTGTVTLGGSTVDDALVFNLDNAGTFNVSTGTALVNLAGTTNSAGGSFQVASGALLNYASGNHTFNGTTGGGAGALRVSGGTVNFTGASAMGNLELTGGTLSASAGATTSAGNLAMSGGTLAGTGQLSVTGANSTWTGGVLAGNLRVAPGGTLTLAGGAKVIGTGGVLTNQGNVAWTAGNINTPASTNGAATIVNAAGGLFDIQGDVAFVDPVDDSGAFTMTVTLQNQAGGELRRSVGTGVVQLGGGTVDDSLLLNLQNDGTFNIATGAVQVNSYGTATANGGSFQIAGGAVFDVVSGSHTFGNMSSGGAGQWRISGGTVGVSAGASANLSNLAFNGGTLNGPGEVLITGNGSSWNGGLFAGNLRVGAGGTLALAGGTKVLGSGALLTNQGNVVWSAGAIHSPASTNGTATIVNATGGLFDIQGDVAMLDPVDDSGAFTLTVTMQNQAGGELRRSVGTGTVTLGGSTVDDALVFNLDNAGTFNVSTGTVVQALGGFASSTNNGNITIASGATLSTNGASFTSAANGAISGSGTLNLGAATLTNNGAINPGGMNAAGTLTVTGSVVMGATSNLNIEIAGNAPGQYDVLAISGSLQAGGNLNATEILAFLASPGENYPVVTFGSSTGNFTINAPAIAHTPLYNANDFTLSVVPAINTWTANFGGLWDQGINWSLGHAPTAAEDAVINDISGVQTVTVSAAGQAAKRVTVSGADDTLFLGSNGSLNLSGAGNSTITNLTLAGGNLTATGSVTVTGNLSWNSGAIDGPGLFVTANTSTTSLIPTGTKTLVNKTWDNYGTATWTGGLIDLQGASAINNRPGAIFVVNTANAAQDDINGATSMFKNFAGATFNVAPTASAADVTIISRFDNDGTVNVDGTNLDLHGPGNHTGTFNVNTALRLRDPQPHDFAAGSVVAGGGTVEVWAATLNIANPSGFSPGTFIVKEDFGAGVAGTVNVAAGSWSLTNYQQSNGAVNGVGTNLLVANSFSQTNGTIAGFGTVNALHSSGDLVVNSISATNTTLNAGLGNIVGAGNSAINVQGSSVGLFASAGAIGDALPIQAAVNSVTFQGGAGNVRISNTGALDVGAGISSAAGDVYLNAGGALTQTGSLSIPGNVSASGSSITLLNPNNSFGGTVSLGSGSDASVAAVGGLQFGTVSVGGNLTGTATLIQQTSAITVPGTASFTATSGAVTMNTPGNDFGTFAALATGAIDVTDANGVALGSISTPGAVTVTAGGALSQTGGMSAASLNFTSAGGAMLNAGSNVPVVSFTNTGGGNVLFTGTAPSLLVSGSTTGGGSLSVLNTGAIQVNSGLTNAGGDTAVAALGGAVNIGAGGLVQSGAANAVGVQGLGVQSLSGSIVGGSGGVAVNAASGTLVNAGTITNGGSGSQITLRGDTMSLAGGSVNAGSGTILVRTDSDAQPITLGSGPGLSLSAADLATLVGVMQIGATTHTGGIVVNAPIARTSALGNTLYTNGAIGFANDFNISGGGALSVIGGSVNVANGSVQASSIFLSGGSITVQPDSLATANASVVAATDLSINAGTLTLRGSDTMAGLGAKLQAANSIVIGATSLSITGGNAANAPARIDPQSVTIASTGDLVLQGGAGAGSVAQVTGNTVAMTGASIQLLGGSGDGSYALVDSGVGGTTIAALSGGTLQIAAGTGLNSNAGVVSLGTVNTGATSCATCAVLTTNPYSPPNLSATGFYGAGGVLIAAAAAGAGGSGGTGGAVLDEVLVLLVNNAVKTVQIAESGAKSSGSASADADDGTPGTGGSDDDQKKRKKNVPKCN